MSVRTRAALVLLASFGLLAGPAAAGEGTASGTITVNGKTTKLAHAYARAVPGFFDKSKEDVEVVLTDVPLEAKALTDVFERIHMADAGKLHAFEITIDADGKPISTAFRDNGFKKAAPSGLSSEDVFTKKLLDAKTVAGSYKSAKVKEFFGDTYSFDVSFSADIARAPKALPPSAAETAAAQKSTQAKVYAEYLAAIQKEDLAGLKRVMAAETAKELNDPKAKDMLKMIKMMSATDVKPLKLAEHGDTAELSVTGKQDGNVANGVVHMVKEGGAWKVQREEWKN